MTARAFIDIVFDGPPGPEPGRLVECENPNRRSIDAGQWIDRGDGTWALRIAGAVTAEERALLDAAKAYCAGGWMVSDADHAMDAAYRAWVATSPDLS